MRHLTVTERTSSSYLNIAADMVPESIETPIKSHNNATAVYYLNKYGAKEAEIQDVATYINSFNENYLRSEGLGYYITSKAPNSYKDLKEYEGQAIIPVYSGGSSRTIYPEIYMNYNFRAVYDFHQLYVDWDFSYAGESKAIEQHYRSLMEFIKFTFKNSRQELLLRKVFLADTIGQVAYYYENKEYVQDQFTFVKNLVNKMTLAELENLLVGKHNV